MNTFPDGFGELARFREGLYRVFAAAFRPPRPEQFPRIVKDCEPLELMGLRCLAIYREWRPWRKVSRDIDEVGRIDPEYVPMTSTGMLRTDSARTGGLHATDSVRGDAHETLGSLAGLYNEIRLEPTGAISDMLDQVSVELEIMSTLCAREASARAEDNDQRLELTLRSEVTFLDRHLDAWLPHFVDQITGTSAIPFYATLGPTVASFVHHDTGVARFLVRELAESEELR